MILFSLHSSLTLSGINQLSICHSYLLDFIFSASGSKNRPLFMVPLSTDKEAFFLLSPPEDLVLNKVSGLTQNM
jgi:hypothetical protein